MSKFCSKCGSEIIEGNKFCKQCGAAVESPMETDNRAVVVRKKQLDKKSIIKLGAAVVVIVLLISLLANAFGVPAYEKPLRNQVAAINQNNVKKYFKTFTDVQREELEDDDLEEYYEEDFKEIKKMSYKVVGTSTMSGSLLEDLWDLTESYLTTGVEEVMILNTEITYETIDGEKGTVDIDFDVVKIKGKWYAMTDLTD